MCVSACVCVYMRSLHVCVICVFTHALIFSTLFPLRVKVGAEVSPSRHCVRSAQAIFCEVHLWISMRKDVLMGFGFIVRINGTGENEDTRELCWCWRKLSDLVVSRS